MSDDTATIQPVLECRNLSISYFTRAGEIPAVVDFNLKLMPGEAHGIVGESGCGKSTVALAIMQYLGQNGAIVSGEILFQGRDMREMGAEKPPVFMHGNLDGGMEFNQQLLEKYWPRIRNW